MNKPKLVNLTPHSVSIFTETEELITLQPNGSPVRLNESRRSIGELDGISLIEKSFSGGNLPDREAYTYYIVSLPVAQAFPDREDLLVCDNFRKDGRGRVMGCEHLARIVDAG